MAHKTEAYPCVWYLCPHCHEGNTVRLTPGSFPSSFSCRHCKRILTVESIMSQGGLTDRDIFNPLAAEFMCGRCGTINIVFTRVTINEDKVIEHPVHPITLYLHTEGGAAPKFGLCETCYTGHELEYPVMGKIFHPNSEN